MTRPAYLPGWVASGNGRSGDFATAMKLAGWAGGEKPAAQEVNEFWANVSDWLAYLDATDQFDTLEALIAGLDVGEEAGLNENDGDDQPGTVYDTTGALVGNLANVAVSGLQYFRCGVGTP